MEEEASGLLAKPACVIEDISTLKNKMNCYKTNALFYEQRFITQSKDDQMYTLKEYDHLHYKSMYQIYMSCASEYEASQVLLGSWRHWKKLCKSPFFQEHIESWRDEREMREKSLGRSILIAQAEEGNVNAAKILNAGEKTKAQVKKAAAAKKVEEVIEEGMDSQDKLLTARFNKIKDESEEPENGHRLN